MSSFLDAVESALLRLAKGRAPAALRMLACHAAQIISMRAAGTADVATDDEAVGGPGGLGGRPVLVGLPGVKLSLAGGGDRVRVGFEGGSPAGAEVTAFEQDPAADRPAARKGDRIQIGTLLLTVITTPVPAIQVAFTPAGSPFGAAGTPIILLFAGAAIVSGIEPLVPYAIEAWIATGSPEIALRRLSTEEIL